MDLAPSCPLPPGRRGIRRSSPPSLTCVSAITGPVRRVAWQESPSYGRPWAGGLLVGPLESPGCQGKLNAAPDGALPLPPMADLRVWPGRTATVRQGVLQWVLRGQRRHQVSLLLHRRVFQVRLGMTSDQQAWHWDGERHADHSGWHAGWVATGCAEQQGHRNACSALPATAQVQRHTLLHQREWWHQMCRGGALPKDVAGHDSLTHDGQQEQAFRGRPAGPVAHL